MMNGTTIIARDLGLSCRTIEGAMSSIVGTYAIDVNANSIGT